MKIALAQMNPEWESKLNNIDICRSFIQKAKKIGVDLIAFPEMTLTGFSMQVALTSETIINGSSFTLDFFRQEAIKHHINVGFGMVQGINPAKNMYYILDEQGKIILDYSKIHPFSFGEEGNYFIGGDHIEYCLIGDTCISAFICYDLRFPEVFSQASKKADFILVASNWPKSRIDHFTTLLKARAIENQCYIAGVNRVGNANHQEYSGNSALYNIDGIEVSNFIPLDSEEENFYPVGLLIGEINPEKVAKRRTEFKVKTDRREDLYHSFYDANNR